MTIACNRVVVGYDGSSAARRALVRAAEILDAPGRLVLVRVEAQLMSGGAFPRNLREQEDGTSDLLAEARAGLELPADIAISTVERVGDPAEELADVATTEAAELLLVGRRGDDFEARALLGSVAARVIELAPCDVLVVR